MPWGPRLTLRTVEALKPQESQGLTSDPTASGWTGPLQADPHFLHGP